MLQERKYFPRTGVVYVQHSEIGKTKQPPLHPQTKDKQKETGMHL